VHLGQQPARLVDQARRSTPLTAVRRSIRFGRVRPERHLQITERRMID
jgi:hypothetical protein